MARYIHRQGDSRICGATTVNTQTTVRANGRFISIDLMLAVLVLMLGQAETQADKDLNNGIYRF